MVGTISDRFDELTQAAVLVPALGASVGAFCGMSPGGKAGQIIGDFTGCPCNSLTRDEAETLLTDNAMYQPSGTGQTTGGRGAAIATRRRICP